MNPNKVIYPCNHCGECSRWLAFREKGELETPEELYAACVKSGCNIFGREVKTVEFENAVINAFDRLWCLMLELPDEVREPIKDRFSEFAETLNYLEKVHNEANR